MAVDYSPLLIYERSAGVIRQRGRGKKEGKGWGGWHMGFHRRFGSTTEEEGIGVLSDHAVAAAGVYIPFTRRASIYTAQPSRTLARHNTAQQDRTGCFWLFFFCLSFVSFRHWYNFCDPGGARKHWPFDNVLHFLFYLISCPPMPDPGRGEPSPGVPRAKL